MTGPNKYPVNEGISGYWDTLSPEDLARYDQALDYVFDYIKIARVVRTGGDELSAKAIAGINSHMPDPITCFRYKGYLIKTDLPIE
ncbi:MAG: hypothetical protein H6799_01890 [Candidatus Nomurabacteria bacterium]|nr:MAG: hypothetical protein H6799_01890 [Candidatus Nomurabacteria bacterium]HRV76291.1 hypothetical protein [Candidatus Saccharimonadales bacterium]